MATKRKAEGVEYHVVLGDTYDAQDVEGVGSTPESAVEDAYLDEGDADEAVVFEVSVKRVGSVIARGFEFLPDVGFRG